jgi:hypothetical protein
MAQFTKVLRPKEISNGRLIMVQGDCKAVYGYIIFESETESWHPTSKRIVSGYDYGSWKAAMKAGKEFALTL